MTIRRGQGHTTEQGAAAPADLDHPTKLFVETTTRCNLGCPMCVKQTTGCEMHEGDMSPETFAALAPAFPHLDALILNGIGEPLLNPHLETFIRTAKSLMPATGWVGFQSNGLLLTNLKAVALVDAGLDRICLSMDAVSPVPLPLLRQRLAPAGGPQDIRQCDGAGCDADLEQPGIPFVPGAGHRL